MAVNVQQTLDGLPLKMPKRKSYTRKFKPGFVILILIHTSAPVLLALAAVYANALDQSIDTLHHVPRFVGVVKRILPFRLLL